MKKITIKILACLSLSLAANYASAYSIYNQMDGSDSSSRFGVYVEDTHGLGGIYQYVGRDKSVACAPKSFGCSGTLNFRVTDEYDGDILCEGKFKIDKSPGHYFVITTNKQSGPICIITHYRD